MKARHSSFGAHLALALVAGATTWVAMLSWRPFTVNDPGFLVPLLALAVTVAVLGAVGRWRRVPTMLVLGGQLVVGGALASYLIAGTPVPGAELRLRIDGAFDAANAYASPVPDDGLASVLPLLVVGGLGAMLLVDLLAGGLRRVSLAGLPLLIVYSVPVGMLAGDLEWWVFALSALGFAALLYLQEQDRLGRWGRSLDAGAAGPAADSRHPGAAPRRRSAAIATSAGGIALLATAAAVVVPLAIPTLQLQVFDVGNGGGGDGEINIVNPIVDLRRDLKQGADIPLVRFRTDDPNPDYLRISALNRFTDNEWSSGDRDVPSDQVAEGALPPLDGVSATVPRREYSYDVSIEPSFESTWLPTWAPISSITAPGDWRYDTDTMDFIASDDDLDTSGLDYAMTAVDLDLTARRLSTSATTTASVGEEVRDLPDDLPGLVSDLARDVTADAPTPYAKAVALQNWFRDNFTYDLEASPNGNGVDDLVAFLREDGRVGYCEQFAASMAVMARVLGIPSRVAVGFLNPHEMGADTWEFRAGDLHAWPELYFSGFGWVLFEPTPADRAAQVPAYTRQDVPVDNPSEPPSTSASPEPRPGQADRPDAAPVDPVDEQSGAQAADDGRGSWVGLGAVVLVVVLVLVAAAPRAVRRRRRARRLESDVEDAWAELRDTCIDLGVAWPDARTPRETQSVLAESFADPDLAGSSLRPAHGAAQAPAATSALARLAAELERQRYAPRPSVPPAGRWHDDVVSCSEALAAGVNVRARRRARWLPRSLWRSTPVPARMASEAEQLGRVVEHI